MHTVFDLIGTFVVMQRKQATGPYTSIHERQIVLHADMAPSQCCFGRSVLGFHAKEKAKEHIHVLPLEHVWYKDWDLKERKVHDDKSEAA